jgi:hypothetical protein
MLRLMSWEDQDENACAWVIGKHADAFDAIIAARWTVPSHLVAHLCERLEGWPGLEVRVVGSEVFMPTATHHRAFHPLERLCVPEGGIVLGVVLSHSRHLSDEYGSINISRLAECRDPIRECTATGLRHFPRRGRTCAASSPASITRQTATVTCL